MQLERERLETELVWPQVPNISHVPCTLQTKTRDRHTATGMGGGGGGIEVHLHKDRILLPIEVQRLMHVPLEAAIVASHIRSHSLVASEACLGPDADLSLPVLLSTLEDEISSQEITQGTVQHSVA